MFEGNKHRLILQSGLISAARRSGSRSSERWPNYVTHIDIADFTFAGEQVSRRSRTTVTRNSSIGRIAKAFRNGRAKVHRKCQMPSCSPWVDRTLVMSSLVENNAGKQIMHAVPWVSDTRSQHEKRCLQEAVIEARQRLEGELSERLSFQTPKQPSQRAAIGFELPAALPSEDSEESLEEMNLRVWSALEPG